jgi:vacuolar-type H+-ATPase subunit B/Vma2
VVSVGADGHITDATIRLPPLGMITGRVVDGDGEPVDGAQVLLYKLAYRDGRKSWDNRDRAVASDTGNTGFRISSKDAMSCELLIPGRRQITAPAPRRL